VVGFSHGVAAAAALAMTTLAIAANRVDLTL
jgi:hypothetical protein